MTPARRYNRDEEATIRTVAGLLATAVRDTPIGPDESRFRVHRAQAARLLDAGLLMTPTVATELYAARGRSRTEPCATCGPTGGQLPPQLLKTLIRLAEGDSVTESARRMGLTPNTIKTHRLRLYKRLGARNPQHAVWLALSAGLIQMQPAEMAVAS